MLSILKNDDIDLFNKYAVMYPNVLRTHSEAHRSIIFNKTNHYNIFELLTSQNYGYGNGLYSNICDKCVTFIIKNDQVYLLADILTQIDPNIYKQALVPEPGSPYCSALIKKWKLTN